ncbi:DegV family protein [Neobacillus niacini]|uniref:DegV family protein n=1 Tax=Neobacillus niacini TaxID=86668 RepID=UPI003002121A
MHYPNIFKEGKIGNLTLKNRIVMPPMGTNLAGPEGEVTDQLIAYYEERAKGGTGLLIVEFTCIDYEYGKGFIRQLRLDDDRFIPGIHRVANAVHNYGAKVFVQIHHAGRQSNSSLINGKQIVAPSTVACAAVGEEPRELTTPEVKELVNKFVQTAIRCQQAGIDGVEVHAAHGYLINQFLSPEANVRSDEYGGSFENRMRFIEEIIVGIKENCGKDYPVTVRVNVDDFTEEGIDLQLGKNICLYLEKLGVDGLHISCGTYDSMDKIIESPLFEQGWRVYLAEEIKKGIDIPVITFDSHILTAPMTALLKKGMELVEAGNSPESVIDQLESLKTTNETYVLIGSLEQLHRSGRMSGLQFFLGSMLNVKPIISIEAGALNTKEKVRSDKKAKEKILEYFKSSYEEHKFKEVYILYGLHLEHANEWKMELERQYPELKVICCPLGAVIGVHAGENTLGISWHNGLK